MKQIAAFISNYPAGFGVSIPGRKNGFIEINLTALERCRYTMLPFRVRTLGDLWFLGYFRSSGWVGCFHVLPVLT